MKAVVAVLVSLVFAVVGFVAGGLFARFVVLDDTTGLEGGATVFLCGMVGLVLGLVVAFLVLRR